MKIMITGATGQLGSLVLEHLLEKVPSSQVIAIVRNKERASSLQKSGVEIREADYNDPESLQKAFDGGTKLLFISSSEFDEPLCIVQHANVVKAARDAEIKHIMYTSLALAEDPKLGRTHFITENAILTTHIPYTFLRNAGYTDFFVNPTLKRSVENGVLITNAKNGKLNTVTRNDLARAAATILSEDGHKNKVYTLVSNQLWSFDDLAQILSEVSGKSVLHQSVSFEEEKKILVNEGVPEAFAETMAFIYNTIAEGQMAKTTDDLQKLIGSLTPLKETVKSILGQ